MLAICAFAFAIGTVSGYSFGSKGGNDLAIRVGAEAPMPSPVTSVPPIEYVWVVRTGNKTNVFRTRRAARSFAKKSNLLIEKTVLR